MKGGFRVLDSDLHILEPPNLWERYIDAPFKHQAPRGFADRVADLRIEIDGKLMPAGVDYGAGAARRDRERFRRFHERGWSAAAQIEAMDEEGIDGLQVPGRGRTVPRAPAARRREARDPLGQHGAVLRTCLRRSP